MSSLKTLPAPEVPFHVVRCGILDDSWGEECDRGCVVAGEDLDSPPFISRINNIVSTNNRTFDSRQNLQNRGGGGKIQPLPLCGVGGYLSAPESFGFNSTDE